MSNFSIRIVREKIYTQHITTRRRPAILVEIRIGEFVEQIPCPTDRWSPEEYEQQWSHAKWRLANGESRACFVVGMHPPEVADTVEVFGAWRQGQAVHFQQFSIDVVGRYAIDDHLLTALMRPYSRTTSEGNYIHDDWSVPASVFAGSS